MASPSQSLESLGATIAELTKALSTQLQAARIPELSFAPDAPASLPPTPEIQTARTRLQEALLTLSHLVTGPHEFWFREVFGVSDAALPGTLFAFVRRGVSSTRPTPALWSPLRTQPALTQER
jgi:hypothetical protein